MTNQKIKKDLPDAKPNKKRTTAQRANDLTELLSGHFSTDNPFSNCSFNRKWKIFPNLLGGAPVLLEHNADKVCSYAEVGRVASMLLRFIASEPFKFAQYQGLNPTSARGIVKMWIDDPAKNQILDAWPRPFAFCNEDVYCFHQLDYEPDMSQIEPPELFKDVFKRVVANGESLSARIGSIFDFDTDRKQAVWIYGVKDCGKSSVMDIISMLMGGKGVVKPEVNRPDSFLKSTLLNNRVALCDEAPTKFIRSDLFKNLTGDLTHTINPKGKAAFNAPLPLLYFLTSNDAPKIPHDDALKVRIIAVPMVPIGENKYSLSQFKEIAHSQRAQIAGYCLNKYREIRDNMGRLPNDMTALKEGLDDYSGAQLDFIEMYFEPAKGKLQLTSEVRKLIKIEIGGNYDSFLNTIKDIFRQIKCVEVKRFPVYKDGMQGEIKNLTCIEDYELNDQAIQILRGQYESYLRPKVTHAKMKLYTN